MFHVKLLVIHLEVMHMKNWLSAVVKWLGLFTQMCIRIPKKESFVMDFHAVDDFSAPSLEVTSVRNSTIS